MRTCDLGLYSLILEIEARSRSGKYSKTCKQFEGVLIRHLLLELMLMEQMILELHCA